MKHTLLRTMSLYFLSKYSLCDLTHIPESFPLFKTDCKFSFRITIYHIPLNLIQSKIYFSIIMFSFSKNLSCRWIIRLAWCNILLKESCPRHAEWAGILSWKMWWLHSTQNHLIISHCWLGNSWLRVFMDMQ